MKITSLALSLAVSAAVAQNPVMPKATPSAPKSVIARHGDVLWTALLKFPGEKADMPMLIDSEGIWGCPGGFTLFVQYAGDAGGRGSVKKLVDRNFYMVEGETFVVSRPSSPYVGACLKVSLPK